MFLDESGFLLIPNVKRTWAPKGKTPYFYHWFKQDRVSAISALTVSPKRKRMALYLRFRSRNLKGSDVQSFLSLLLRHLRGPVILLWDRGSIHRDRRVQAFRKKHPRLRMEYFPAYAPELNPAEYVWNQADSALSNTASDHLTQLRQKLHRCRSRLQASQKLLWSCIYASDLPWTR